MIKRLTVTIEGVDDGDIEMALGEVKRLVGEGYTSGFNDNETGAYNFGIVEEFEPELAWTPSETARAA